MTQHAHSHGHQHAHHEEHLADLLDLDAALLRGYLDEVTAWLESHLPGEPSAIADLGAGTGTGSVALARRFPSAHVSALDRSELMLDRVATAVREHGVAERVSTVRADLDDGLPALGTVELAWASSSLHEVADPGRLLRDVHTALAPGGVLVVVEMDGIPRFLPDDLGLGTPGLERRCHEAVARAGWNAHPDWRSHLERAGFEVTGQRRFELAPDPAAEGTVRYAHGYLSRIHRALESELDTDDLGVLDRLLSADDPESLAHRTDLEPRTSRTAWVARRN
ncbi:class I SAM-dependent methyltransferase [Prauserella cavernicola]|uniref:Methyltransferase domain-containing protein n=1 Tax=Prauserella cavernicola TaxID=2800127 RepID=A0A934QSR7_9PSEU|nr:class I SAM-dependent methyltransferase [Prauserella cavernicola]MBK1785961.1 methyltransferase domain-containing protein [Prauserella cavernicola]